MPTNTLLLLSNPVAKIQHRHFTHSEEHIIDVNVKLAMQRVS